jgi:hypothetical protein
MSADAPGSLSHGLPTVPVVTDQFDFLVGRWSVHNRRLHAPLTGSQEWYDTPADAVSRTQHGGAISVDEMWFPEQGYAGTSFRVRTEDNRWTIYWVNSATGHLQPPVSGRWNDDGTRFEGVGSDEYDGRPILARYAWHSITADRAVWDQAFSPDDGATWETNWVMTWTRRSGDDR